MHGKVPKIWKNKPFTRVPSWYTLTFEIVTFFSQFYGAYLYFVIFIWATLNQTHQSAVPSRFASSNLLNTNRGKAKVQYQYTFWIWTRLIDVPFGPPKASPFAQLTLFDKHAPSFSLLRIRGVRKRRQPWNMPQRFGDGSPDLRKLFPF